jgi:HPt (histidine-containing phosphotransfer) domain-containing protein
LRFTAHKLKGSCKYLGAYSLAQICEQIEQRSEHEDLSKVADLLVELQECYTQTQAELLKIR